MTRGFGLGVLVGWLSALLALVLGDALLEELAEWAAGERELEHHTRTVDQLAARRPVRIENRGVAGHLLTWDDVVEELRR